MPVLGSAISLLKKFQERRTSEEIKEDIGKEISVIEDLRRRIKELESKLNNASWREFTENTKRRILKKTLERKIDKDLKLSEWFTKRISLLVEVLERDFTHLDFDEQISSLKGVSSKDLIEKRRGKNLPALNPKVEEWFEEMKGLDAKLKRFLDSIETMIREKKKWDQILNETKAALSVLRELSKVIEQIASKIKGSKRTRAAA